MGEEGSGQLILFALMTLSCFRMWLLLKICTTTFSRFLSCLRMVLRFALSADALMFLIVRENLSVVSPLLIGFFELIFLLPLALLDVCLLILFLSFGSGIGDWSLELLSS